MGMGLGEEEMMGNATSIGWLACVIQAMRMEKEEGEEALLQWWEFRTSEGEK